tara:strand:- start:255 stop:995 length:741 start_codon:yes stop_codon:yes gene_type:complete
LEILKKSLLELDIDFSKDLEDKLDFFCAQILESSKKFNLTGYKSLEDIESFLIIRSYRYVKAINNYKKDKNYIKKNLDFLDLGTGAGIPSLPIKFLYPNLNLKLVDSSNKKCDFIEEIINKMELGKISVERTRAESLGISEDREKYDVVLTRALAKLPTLAELSIGLIKVNGIVVTAKGKFPDTELNQSKFITNIMGVKKHEIILIEEPTYIENDNFVIWKKNFKTPKKYPRRNGMPKKEPIIKKK